MCAACGVRPFELIRVLRSRLGQSKSEGDSHLHGDSLCGVRSVGNNWPWALVRKSRANFWACLPCTEQGLACTHAEAARIAVSEAAAGKAAEEEAVNQEEPVDRVTRLEKIKFFNRRSHLPRSAAPSVNACKHDAELGQNAFQRLRYKYKPVDACPSCKAVFLRRGHRGEDGGVWGRRGKMHGYAVALFLLRLECHA